MPIRVPSFRPERENVHFMTYGILCACVHQVLGHALHLATFIIPQTTTANLWAV